MYKGDKLYSSVSIYKKNGGFSTFQNASLLITEGYLLVIKNDNMNDDKKISEISLFNLSEISRFATEN